jgi:hypothetical protein
MNPPPPQVGPQLATGDYNAQVTPPQMGQQTPLAGQPPINQGQDIRSLLMAQLGQQGQPPGPPQGMPQQAAPMGQGMPPGPPQGMPGGMPQGTPQGAPGMGPGAPGAMGMGQGRPPAAGRPGGPMPPPPGMEDAMQRRGGGQAMAQALRGTPGQGRFNRGAV